MAQRRAKPETKIAAAWKAFHDTSEGRLALAALFRQFGFFDTPASSDQTILIRSVGQRDVLTWISQQINMKPEAVIQDDGDTGDILDRVMRSN